ncbi:hypothetical protein BDP27DRAFT_583250 [Rhodocollybia butyracea]|uniref:Uncharacterized protein n=1 Tax=Rhodocollybia butyracea TaxID=206335 RepID=A0A9P5PR69_9AGAR|nr:hypothetical protein BDP27DRAFT_583250 [Rhodocollybia butyracea]
MSQNFLPPVDPTKLPRNLGLDPYYHLVNWDLFKEGIITLPDAANGASLVRKIKEAPFWSLLEPKYLGLDPLPDVRPVETSHLYSDDGQIKELWLVVYNDDHSLPARHRHWGIRWAVNRRYPRTHDKYPQAARCLEVETDLQKTHLVNWGPLTTLHKFVTTSSIAVFSLGKYTRQQRVYLEAISWHLPIQYPPDGVFNCQNWCAALLGIAVACDMIKVEVVRDVLQQALQQIIPDPRRGPFSIPE